MLWEIMRWHLENFNIIYIVDRLFSLIYSKFNNSIIETIFDSMIDEFSISNQLRSFFRIYHQEDIIYAYTLAPCMNTKIFTFRINSAKLGI